MNGPSENSRNSVRSFIRWLPRLVIPLALAAALAVDARAEQAQPSVETAEPLAAVQVAVPPPDALTSSWFCPLVGLRASVQSFGEITAEVHLTNMTDSETSASIELRGRTTGRQSVKTDIAPHGTGIVRVSDYMNDEVIGALVEASSGGLAVSRRFVSPLGIDIAGCSSLLARQWHIPVGDTQADALAVVAIMNPLPRDAIIDVTFASEAELGPFVAPELTGVVVPAWSTVAVDIGEHARRRDVVAASIRARTGRIAVDSLVAYDGSFGRRGLAAELASHANGERWTVPLAGIDDRTKLWVRVMNPSEEVAAVAASVVAEGSQGDRVSFAVAPQDVAELEVEVPGDLAPDLQTLLADPGTPFGVTVSSQNGVPIVVWAEALVGRSTSPATPETDSADLQVEAQPAEAPPEEPQSELTDRPSVLRSRSGLAFVPGVASTRGRWLVVVAPEPDSEAFLTIMTDLLASGASGTQSEAEDRRVVVQTLSGEPRAVIDVPESGVVTHPLASGTTRLLVSDTPFVAMMWQTRFEGDGLSVAPVVQW